MRSIAAGDVTGDGNAGIAIGPPFATAPSGGNANAGSAYIYYSKSSHWPNAAYGLGGLCTGTRC
jgi:hypothetical protein